LIKVTCNCSVPSQLSANSIPEQLRGWILVLSGLYFLSLRSARQVRRSTEQVLKNQKRCRYCLESSGIFANTEEMFHVKHFNRSDL